MREITKIVIHHSLTPRDQDIETAMASFDRNHKVRLYEEYQQPISNSEYKYIAYHYCIGGDGTVRAGRSLDVPGYHASNYAVNLESIGICLLGNFDKERPTKEQIEALKNLVKDMKREFPAIDEVSGHRDYASKSCPGDNFDQDIIDDLNKLLNGEESFFTEDFIRSHIERNSAMWESLQTSVLAIKDSQDILHKENEKLRELL